MIRMIVATTIITSLHHYHYGHDQYYIVRCSSFYVFFSLKYFGLNTYIIVDNLMINPLICLTTHGRQKNVHRCPVDLKFHFKFLGQVMSIDTAL